MLLPGVVQPAALGYAGLIENLADEAEAVAKDLALYAGEVPPAGYSLDYEIEDVIGAAGRAGFERFHLVGFSGGGAIALALASRHPERLLSLALIEPAWTGRWQMSAGEEEIHRELDRLLDPSVGDAEMMQAFVRLQLRAGVEPPPPPPPSEPQPEWMAKRPAGIRALTRAFREWDYTPEALESFDRPVYFALGTLSNPDFWEPMAERLSGVFADFQLERWEDCHHFAPPHRTRPEDFAASLATFHHRAERR